ncbi:hypothetical protein ETAA8_09520 [Anatilimnocola aggregata]|uniref:Uncharacterized protein n=2 Tax=Anatilimnocola aggregata TaxID=2528021 RepID=A0A517Y6N6_9BACT|nr:hypothetical protein ETAA8_09520 [Anatilimnocola aggregata]
MSDENTLTVEQVALLEAIPGWIEFCEEEDEQCDHDDGDSCHLCERDNEDKMDAAHADVWNAISCFVGIDANSEVVAKELGTEEAEVTNAIKPLKELAAKVDAWQIAVALEGWPSGVAEEVADE